MKLRIVLRKCKPSWIWKTLPLALYWFSYFLTSIDRDLFPRHCASWNSRVELLCRLAVVGCSWRCRYRGDGGSCYDIGCSLINKGLWCLIDHLCWIPVSGVVVGGWCCIYACAYDHACRLWITPAAPMPAVCLSRWHIGGGAKCYGCTSYDFFHSVFPTFCSMVSKVDHRLFRYFYVDFLYLKSKRRIRHF